MQNDRSLRIRTKVGDEAPKVINVQLGQTYDTLDILSLKLKSEGMYQMYQSDYGVIVGRVLASGNFGIPNAKVSLFIPVKDNEETIRKVLYNYKSLSARNYEGVRYNLLPDEVISECYQNVGTFVSKRFLLDNNDYIELFNDYWKYTTVTNNAGDYMLFGVPVGGQTIHVDIDLSDIGPLSQRPRDMLYQGFNINQFESPNMFKSSTDLDSLAQIKSQDKGVNVYPFWGDTSQSGEDTIGITRCDINIQYKFQPTCVFMGSVVTDTGNRAISKNCVGASNMGEMDGLVTGEGSIEMIRKLPNGQVEPVEIKGNRLINGDGVWCYQIPMNLDYVMTDEFGNIVPTDNPEKGIPTRTRVRFRISMDENKDDKLARKRARYLVPNNPRISSDNPNFVKRIENNENELVDYEFGTLTNEESFRDLMWNNVYSVKNYIPRLQASTSSKTNKHTGFKHIKRKGDNNHIPYNNMYVKLTFTYRTICIITKLYITLMFLLNQMIYGVLQTIIGLSLPKLPVVGRIYLIPKSVQLSIAKGLGLHCFSMPAELCEGEGQQPVIYFPGCPGEKNFGAVAWTNDWIKREGKKSCQGKSSEVECGARAEYDMGTLFTCIESALVESFDAASLMFNNDWINGTLYFPLWHRRIKPKRTFLFGLIKLKAKDQWCTADGRFLKVRPYQNCSLPREKSSKDKYINEYGKNVIPQVKVPSDAKCGRNCQKAKSYPRRLGYGVIKRKETFLGTDAYYYVPIEYQNDIVTNENREYTDTVKGDIALIFATDIILLGSLNDCDKNGIPQFFRVLESSTYNEPPSLMATNGADLENYLDENGQWTERIYDEDGEKIEVRTEYTGMDWGMLNAYDQRSKTKRELWGIVAAKREKSMDGGLFYGVTCSDVDTVEKSCLNLSRICELGVTLDESNEVGDLSIIDSEKTKGSDVVSNKSYQTMSPDGFISYDELINLDSRSEFATMNYNSLNTIFDEKNGLYKYDLTYLYPHNFDGALRNIMDNTFNNSTYRNGKTKNGNKITYRFNYLLENFSRDYYRFRMGKSPYFYINGNRFPRYENSFYFYFGLKYGKTALDKLNEDFFGQCKQDSETSFSVNSEMLPNNWCADNIYDELNGDGDLRDGVMAFDIKGASMPVSITLRNRNNKNEVYQIDNIDKEKFYICSYKNKTNAYNKSVIDDLNKRGFVHLNNLIPSYNNDVYPSSGISIPNAVYDVEIFDNNGNLVNTIIKYQPSTLTFETDGSRTFNFEYSYLSELFNGNYDDLSNKDYDFTNKRIVNIANGIDVARRKIGGSIIINNLFDNNEAIRKTSLANYKIHIETIIDDDVWEAEVTFNNNGTPTKKTKFNDTLLNSNDKGVSVNNDDTISVTIPYAPSHYYVTVIMLCNGVESGNSQTSEVIITEPIPTRLLVNEVDSSLITGNNWHFGTQTAIPTASTCNWLKLQDINSYNWMASDEYKDINNSDADNDNRRNDIIKTNGVIDSLIDKIEENKTAIVGREAKINELRIEINNLNKLINQLESIEQPTQTEIDTLTNCYNEVDNKENEIVNLETLEDTNDDLRSQIVENINTFFSLTLDLDRKVPWLKIVFNEYCDEKIIPSTVNIGFDKFLDNLIAEYNIDLRMTISDFINNLLEGKYEVKNDATLFIEKKNEYKNLYTFIDYLGYLKETQSYNFKKETIEKVIKGFIMTSFDDIKSIRLRVTGSDQIYPVTYYLQYQEQGSIDDDVNHQTDTHYYLANNGAVKNEISSNDTISNIGLPNVTNEKNKIFKSRGNITTVNDINVNNTLDATFVNTSNETVGTNKNVNIFRVGITAQNGDINLPKDSVNGNSLLIEKAVTPIIIDKVLIADIVAWSVYERGDILPIDNDNEIITNGMISCELINGAAQQLGNKRIFEEQTLFEEPFDIFYHKYDPLNRKMETSLAVDSYILSTNGNNYNEADTTFYNYNRLGIKNCFIKVDKPTAGELSIMNEGGKFLLEDIYTNIKVFVEDCEINIEPKFDLLTLSAFYYTSSTGSLSFKSNVSVDTDVIFYLFPYGDSINDKREHPLLSIKDGRFTKTNGLFDTDTPLETMRKNSNKELKGIAEYENGSYTIKKIPLYRRYIVVASTPNGCRGISSILDFTIRYVDFCVIYNDNEIMIAFKNSTDIINGSYYNPSYLDKGCLVSGKVKIKEGSAGDVKIAVDDEELKESNVTLASTTYMINGSTRLNNFATGNISLVNADGVTALDADTINSFINGLKDITNVNTLHTTFFGKKCNYDNLYNFVSNNKVYLTDLNNLKIQSCISNNAYIYKLESDDTLTLEKKY